MDNNDMKNWIVVVDDEPVSLTSARRLLAAEDMRISCLPSGRSLLKFMENNTPDLILLDVMMPETDGFETFAALRELEKRLNRSETPIIFLTGESDHETEHLGLKLGAADYIRKPFNRDILISRIRNIVNNRKKIVSLTEDATRDGLTGLLNKAGGEARIREALVSVSGALLTLDIDSFKLVNDLFGHEKGDQILKAFAELVRGSTREGDILCRMGGDEFLLFCCGLYGEKAVATLSRRLNQELEMRAKEVLGADHGIPLGISAGAVMAPDFGTDFDVLFHLADVAMYRAKRNGKHGYTIYTEAEDSSGEAGSPGEELDRITKIIGERNPGREAMVLGTDAFSTVFQFVERLNGSCGTKGRILLFIVAPGPAADGGALNRALAAFEGVLKKSLGKSDVIMKSKNDRFVVLHPVEREAEAGALAGRILAEWEKVPESAGFVVRSASQLR